MRVILRLLGTRYGIALVLMVLVLGVVAAFRGVAGTRRADSMAPPIEPVRSTSIAPSAGDDGLMEDDRRSPSLAASAAAEATAAATGFADAWLRHTGVTAEQWRSGLARHATSALLDRLKGVDPLSVPADHTAGTTTLAVRDPALAVATVPLDAGTLRLTLVISGGHWKVDGVDWDRPQ